MKKYNKSIIAVVCVSFVLLGGLRYFLISNPVKSSISPPQDQQQSSKSKITVVIDSSESIATYDGVLASTAFDALEHVSQQYSIPIIKKQYNFGVSVSGIGSYVNTNDKAWIYLVNGVSGEVAADKKSVKNGDQIMWQYKKPSY